MSNKPLVSVVIPVWNGELVLDEAIESVVSQTYGNLEILIINDASTDSTSEIANSWAAKDSRVRVIRNANNLGIGASRKKGVEESEGEFICWQDADDIALPYRIARQVEVLTSDVEVGVVGGYLQFFDETGNGVVRKYETSDKSLRRSIFRYNPVAQPAAMFRAEVFNVIGNYNETLDVSEDLEMFLRTGERFKFANIDGVAIKYRQSKGSLTASRLKKMERATLALRRQFRNSPAYEWTLIDSVYNNLQSVTLFIPVKLRMYIFGIVRGDRKSD